MKTFHPFLGNYLDLPSLKTSVVFIHLFYTRDPPWFVNIYDCPSIGKLSFLLKMKHPLWARFYYHCLNCEGYNDYKQPVLVTK